MAKYDFSGWATRNNIKCSDGRTICKDAFAGNDGQIVPLVWNHGHSDIKDVLGHALLENRADGVYAYGSFNDSELGQYAKELVRHGDIASLSIYANELKQKAGDVIHGKIREVSLVLAGANPGAFIDVPMAHSEDSEEEGFIYNPYPLDELQHSDKEDDEEEIKMADEAKKTSGTDKTVQDVVNSMTEEQKNVMYYLVGLASEEANGGEDEEDEDVKHNVFENDERQQDTVLTHSAMEDIVSLAKQSNVGSLQNAMAIYASENEAGNELAHSIDSIETLFPEFEDVHPGAPELLTRDQGWITTVMSKAHKSPISRIRTRQADARKAELRAKGYKTKGTKKKEMGNLTLLSRTTDPQTIYIKDKLNRDDIVDITDFDVPAYMYNVMKMTMNEEIATAIMIGDGRETGAEDKIEETHIRSIYNDDDLYCIHADVDLEAAKAELQGTNTGANFSENYVYAEAIIRAALYAKENYKGSGSLDFYCTPHLLNVMLLARDMNGRRIYNSKTDLAAALDVNNIYTAEQFEGKQRTDSEMQKHNLLGIFVNLSDYQIGATKGGEITRFEQFDIDFNQQKYLIETRISGALTKPYSAIALEIKSE